MEAKETCPLKAFFPENASFMDHVRQICSSAKQIPGFKSLLKEDQMILLKASIFEVLVIKLAGQEPQRDSTCFIGLFCKETFDNLPFQNQRSLMNAVKEICQQIKRLQLLSSELELFTSVVILSPDRPGLKNRGSVQQLHEKIKSVLDNHLQKNHTNNRNILEMLVNLSQKLHKVNLIHSENFLQNPKKSLPLVQVDNLKHNSSKWEVDRDSSGYGSPRSLSSYEDYSSTSSSESIGPSEVPKLTSQDLRVNGSVLVNALTSSASLSSCATLINAVGGIPSFEKVQSRSVSEFPTSNDITGAIIKTREINSEMSLPKKAYWTKKSMSYKQEETPSKIDNCSNQLLKQVLQEPPQVSHNTILDSLLDNNFSLPNKRRKLDTESGEDMSQKSCSILASTLNQTTKLFLDEEYQRNEILACFILNEGLPWKCNNMSTSLSFKSHNIQKQTETFANKEMVQPLNLSTKLI